MAAINARQLKKLLERMGKGITFEQFRKAIKGEKNAAKERPE